MVNIFLCSIKNIAVGTNKKLSKGKTPEEIADALEEPGERIKEIILSLEQQRRKKH